jgi:predicted acyltransferase
MTMDKENQQPLRRIASVDALRGFDMFWIIGGDHIFPALFALIGTPFLLLLGRQLEHTEWNGFTFYDLIFPLFMFIMGTAMALSLIRKLESGVAKSKLYGHVIQRSLSLLLLGLIYNGLLNFDFSSFRYAGVLQRFAICYFFASLIVLNAKPRTQAIWAAGILLLYWALMALVPVPGYGAGVLTPEGNLASYIDRLLLPGRFCCFEFGDNEGLLSTLPAISTVLLGVLAGHVLRLSWGQRKKVIYLAAGGIACLIAALLWNFVFPINKLLWSSSYVLYAGGWSALLLALFFWLIDVRGWNKWAFPFIVIGMNPITIYIAQGLFDFGIIANIFVHGFIDHLGDIRPLFWALCVFAVKWSFLLFLYKKKIFLKV